MWKILIHCKGLLLHCPGAGLGWEKLLRPRVPPELDAASDDRIMARDL